MKHLILTLTFCMAVLNSQAGITPDQLFPEDSVLYIEFSDITRMTERWESSPANKQWKSDELNDIRNWVTEDSPLSELFGDEDDVFIRALKESLPLYKGSFAAGVIEGQAWLKTIHEEMDADKDALLENFDLNAPIEDLEDLEALADEEPNPLGPAFIKHIVFIAEMGDNEAKIRAMNIKHAREIIEQEIDDGADSTVVEKKIDGVETLILTTRFEGETETEYIAYLDGIEITTGSKSSLRKMIDHIRKGSASRPLSGNRDYARAKASAEDHDLLIHANLNVIGRYLQKAMADKVEPNPLVGISMAQVAQALELDSLAPMTATLELKPEGLAFRSNLGFTRETRLSKVVLPYIQGTFARPDFIPKDAISVNSLRIGFAPWWDSIIGLVGALSPQMGMMVNMMMLQSQEELGFDLKADFINALGDEVVYAQKMSPQGPAAMDGQSTLVGIKIKNRDSIERVIRKLSTQFTPDGGGEAMEEEEFLGRKIYSLEPEIPLGEGEAPTFAYTFIDDYLVLGIGEKDLVKSAIRTSRNPDQSIWQTAELKRAMSMVPGDTPWFEYGRVDQVFKVMGGLINADMVGGLEPGADPDADAEEENFPDMTPLSTLIGQAVNTSYIEEQRVFTQGFLLYPVAE
jgi:hypothetical protein